MMNRVLDLGRTRRRRTLDKVGGIATVIGEGSRFVGTLEGDDNAVVLGKFEGDCNLQGIIVVEEHGAWKGTIEAEQVVIAGEVEGRVIARHKLEIAATAKIRGTVSGQIIAIAEGAVIEGKVQTRETGRVTHFVEKRVQEIPVAAGDA